MVTEPPLLWLVDDEMAVRESLKMVFGKVFRLLEADNMDVAIAQVRAAHPAVVLLDVLMPKADGIEVLRRIKEIQPARVRSLYVDRPQLPTISGQSDGLRRLRFYR